MAGKITITPNGMSYNYLGGTLYRIQRYKTQRTVCAIRTRAWVQEVYSAGAQTNEEFSKLFIKPFSSAPI